MAPKRRKQKIVICIAGMTGCGKSTIAKRLAKKYGLRYFSGGGALKALAIAAGYKPGGRGWWETEEGTRFLRQRMTDPQFDRRVDEGLIKEAERGNVVLDSWTMPWLLKEGFKVWLEASPSVRAGRIAKRDGISLERAFNALKEKDEKTKTIYKNLYGFDLGEDFSPFDVILDSDELGVEEVFQTLCLVIERLLLKR
jgi:cytidylate kinase